MEAISLLSKGKSNKEICLRLGVSEPTVKVVVSGIMRKSGLKNRTQLAVWAAKNLPAGLV
jgi:DNA-binding NarL/FixJ family response regulator